MAKVTVSFPDDLWKQVDREAKARHRSRSEFIREALRSALKSRHVSARSWERALAPLRRLEESWIGTWDCAAINAEDVPAWVIAPPVMSPDHGTESRGACISAEEGVDGSFAYAGVLGAVVFGHMRSELRHVRAEVFSEVVELEAGRHLADIVQCGGTDWAASKERDDLRGQHTYQRPGDLCDVAAVLMDRETRGALLCGFREALPPG
jgi:Arc/MetJ-type ribon-helix-helix transcriptional regulator